MRKAYGRQNWTFSGLMFSSGYAIAVYSLYNIYMESDSPLWPWRSTELGNMRSTLELNNVAIYMYYSLLKLIKKNKISVRMKVYFNWDNEVSFDSLQKPKVVLYFHFSLA